MDSFVNNLSEHFEIFFYNIFLTYFQHIFNILNELFAGKRFNEIHRQQIIFNHSANIITFKLNKTNHSRNRLPCEFGFFISK